MAPFIDDKIKEVDNINSLTKDERELIMAAVEAAKKAWAPYSSFRVGASVILGNGKILQGNNRENSAFPSGSCAERTVLSYAGANWPEEYIIAIAICALENNKVTEQPVSPCGNCRQLIAEEEDRTGRSIRIILHGRKNTILIDGIDPLLPLRFKLDKYRG